MNTINEWKTKARVTNPDRLALWQAVFGGDEVPIVSIIPEVGHFPGIGEQRFYRLDLRAISVEQRQRLILSIADKFNLTIEEVAIDLDFTRVPVLASDVVVSSSDFGHIASIVY